MLIDKGLEKRLAIAFWIIASGLIASLIICGLA